MKTWKIWKNEKLWKMEISKIEEYLTKESNVLEIGSYYGVLGSLLKPRVKEYNGIELSKHGADFSKKNLVQIYLFTVRRYLNFFSFSRIIIFIRFVF